MKNRILAMVVLAAVAFAGGAFAQDEENLVTLVTAEQVKLALLEKGAGKALPIVVTIDHGTAILTGNVESKVVQELATEVALSVDGVKKVDNRLQIVGETAFNKMTSEQAAKENERELKDARMESSAKIALYKQIGSNARKLEVEAVDGVVSVRGTLPAAAHKQIALETVTRMKDVKKVIDLIKVGG